jgi:hypothetical protein
VQSHCSETRKTHDHILLSHLRLPQPGGPGSCFDIPPGTVGSSLKSKSRYDRLPVNQYVLVSSPRGFGRTAFERSLIRHYEGHSRAKFFTLPLGGLHVKHAVQSGIWVPTQHFLWDQGKPRKTFGRSQNLPDWLLASSPELNTRTLTLVPIYAGSFSSSLKTFTSCLLLTWLTTRVLDDL